MAANKAKQTANRYTMTISRLTVDKLGVKLYDRVYAVLAELIANSYDADASYAVVEAPMNELLAEKNVGVLKDRDFTIIVEDDGCGMTPTEVNDFYLRVGAERRLDPRRGDLSKRHNRRVMGRKGVGKLAPFGVCKRIEVLTSGGEMIAGIDENGKKTKGYLTAHLFLDKDKILTDNDEDYHPETGPLDGIIRPKHGTRLVLRTFEHRRVPALEDLARQLAQRFGVRTANWKITLRDAMKTKGQTGREQSVGQFGVECMPETKVVFKDRRNNKGVARWDALSENGKLVEDLLAGFEYESEFKAVTGWVGYSKQPYRDELMAGVRVYCRGKIAAQTAVFNLNAGFTGEHDVRSYLVGELHADWLDEPEDLIRTDRQDILWSHPLGQAFQNWGQRVVRKVGTLTREPFRRKAWERFLEVSKLPEVVERTYPADAQKDIRDNCVLLAQAIAKTIRQDELDDKEQVQSLIDLSLLLGPHVTLDQKLQQAADSSDRPLAVLTSLLRTARVAELSSFGKIADDRVRVIEKLDSLIESTVTNEDALQELIESAPWLINPQWSPITANQSFTTLRRTFPKYFKQRTGRDIVLIPTGNQRKRADFVLTNQDACIHLIEIKKPDYALTNPELERINEYNDIMTDFLSAPGNAEFAQQFPAHRITLVCDRLALKGVSKTAFNGLIKAGALEHITWPVFLKRATKAHQDFLTEADRQRALASKGWMEE